MMKWREWLIAILSERISVFCSHYIGFKKREIICWYLINLNKFSLCSKGNRLEITDRLSAPISNSLWSRTVSYITQASVEKIPQSQNTNKLSIDVIM